VAKRGPLPKPGLLFDLQSYCFRREPSKDPARMQMFRMREYVRIGTPEQVTAFRAVWLERGREFVRELGLPFDVDLANDPFFGRAGKIMASSQRDQGLKFELLVPIESIEKPTAWRALRHQHAKRRRCAYRLRRLRPRALDARALRASRLPAYASPFGAEAPHAITALHPADHVRHALHDESRDWPETNCYVDLWIELFAARGFAPEAALGFTLTDFEGDQFTFFKFPLQDLEAL
jgi:Domain of unknown function (DUF1839)